jgi:hypothetical protein
MRQINPVSPTYRHSTTRSSSCWNVMQLDKSPRSYTDPGPDHFLRLDPDRVKNRALHQLKQLGYEVTVTQLPD